jgi:hypothetical protein
VECEVLGCINNSQNLSNYMPQCPSSPLLLFYDTLGLKEGRNICDLVASTASSGSILFPNFQQRQ